MSSGAPHHRQWAQASQRALIARLRGRLQRTGAGSPCQDQLGVPRRRLQHGGPSRALPAVHGDPAFPLSFSKVSLQLDLGQWGPVLLLT